jgi:hypothetical protein
MSGAPCLHVTPWLAFYFIIFPVFLHPEAGAIPKHSTFTVF